jgi:coronin-7
VLLPFYDEDTGVLALVSKGESQIVLYDMKFDPTQPTFLSRYAPSSQPHLAVVFLSKLKCDVRKVQIATGYRLTPNSIETLELCVPRIQSEFFQDDIFVPTRDYSSPLWPSSSDWLQDRNKQEPVIVDLKPPDMEPGTCKSHSSHKTGAKTDRLFPCTLAATF